MPALGSVVVQSRISFADVLKLTSARPASGAYALPQRAKGTAPPLFGANTTPLGVNGGGLAMVPPPLSGANTTVVGNAPRKSVFLRLQP